jgi:hypothetical protein
MKKIAQGFMTAAALMFSAIGAHALDVGQKAPLFSAQSTQGDIALAEVYKQKPVILALYYADFTSV